MLGTILNFLGGGIVKQFTDPLLQAYQMRVTAQNDHERLEAEKAIARLEAARDIALAEAGRAWSATSVGRWLIVVPYGLWWAAIFMIQMLNPWLFQPIFGFTAVVIEVPTEIMEMAKVLVPAIVIGDAATFAVNKLRK